MAARGWTRMRSGEGALGRPWRTLRLFGDYVGEAWMAGLFVGCHCAAALSCGPWASLAINEMTFARKLRHMVLWCNGQHSGL